MSAATSDSGRRDTWRRNPRLEALLAELAELLTPVQERLTADAEPPRLPLVLVVGAPRSGTTLMTQWLAASGAFAYPTNLLSRFSFAPALGARIQRLLTDPAFAFRDELFDLGGGFDFSSQLGKTRGALAPNELWYFWRRFVPVVEPRALEPDERAGIDLDGLRRELGALEAAIERPLAAKGMILQYDLDLFAPALSTALFLFVRRDPVHNAQSLLQARERFWGDRARWYSCMPRETDALKTLDPHRQVAGQVHFTNLAIERGLAAVGDERGLAVDYEAFCADPQAAWSALRGRLAGAAELPARHPGPARFDTTNTDRLPADDVRALEQAFAELEGSEALPR